jgi:hypothetical protein
MGTICRNGAANKKDTFEATKVSLVVLDQAAGGCERAAPLKNLLSRTFLGEKQYIQVLSHQI